MAAVSARMSGGEGSLCLYLLGYYPSRPRLCGPDKGVLPPVAASSVPVLALSWVFSGFPLCNSSLQLSPPPSPPKKNYTSLLPLVRGPGVKTAYLRLRLEIQVILKFMVRGEVFNKRMVKASRDRSLRISWPFSFIVQRLHIHRTRHLRGLHIWVTVRTKLRFLSCRHSVAGAPSISGFGGDSGCHLEEHKAEQGYTFVRERRDTGAGRDQDRVKHVVTMRAHDILKIPARDSRRMRGEAVTRSD